MKPRIAATCAIMAFAACGGRAPAQFQPAFPGCANIDLFSPCPLSSEAQGDCEPIIDPQEACQGCQPGEGAWWVVNKRRDGQVKVTIRTTLYNVAPGYTTSTFTDQVLTLAPGERR